MGGRILLFLEASEGLACDDILLLLVKSRTEVSMQSEDNRIL